jgi:hypothetical protein
MFHQILRHSGLAGTFGCMLELVMDVDMVEGTVISYSQLFQ